MANNLAVTNPTNDNLFGAFGGGEQAPASNSSVPNGWASGTVFSPVTPQSAPGAIPTPPSVSQPSATPTAPAPTIPMNYFRNDVGGYNPMQYVNQNAINSVGNFLGPSASFGETYNQGPFDMAPQSTVNWGGNNHNTGLVQNLITQYGPERAMQMMQDEQRFARSQGGGNWTLQNDASLKGYTGNRFAPDGQIPNLFTSNGISPTANNGLLVNQANPGNVQPQQQNPNASGDNPNSMSSMLASLFGLGGQSGVQQNPMLQLLLMLLGGGGNQSAPPMNQSAVAQTPVRSNQYPLFY